MKVAITIIVLLCAFGPWLSNAFNPDAGLANDYIYFASLSASNGDGNASLNVVRDRNLNTYWTGDGCMPIQWRARPDANLLLGFCTPSVCTSTSTYGNISQATDNNMATSYAVNTFQGRMASFNVSLKSMQGSIIQKLGVRFGNIASPVSIYLNPAQGAPIPVGQITATWTDFNLITNVTGLITSISLYSNGNFTIVELGAMREQCYEFVEADLGTQYPVGWISAKFGNRDPSTFSLWTSTDSLTWTQFSNPTDGNDFNFVNFFGSERQARYVRFKLTEPDVNWWKMLLWEVQIFDKYGPYGGPYPMNTPNPRSLREILGICGMWGWGANGLISNTSGPQLYSPIASWARDYHNLDWDITSPSEVANLDYSSGHTQAQSWLNWSSVYDSWIKAGFEYVDASIQFNNQGAFAQSNWGSNPYQIAYNYGVKFAQYMGPHGQNVVRSAEVGNEPWAYDADFYVQVLEGMLAGLNAGDPALLRFPAAFQAYHRDIPKNGDGIFWNDKYVGYRVSQQATTLLHGLNTHCYSYATVNNSWIGVQPEYPSSTQLAYRSMLRWRDANMPGKEVWLTEWGWDGANLCAAADTTCVSLQAQGAYAVRGALLHAREGINRMSWFYFADSGPANGQTGLYGLSGVMFYSPPNVANFTKKPVYYGFNNLLNELGNYSHLESKMETQEAYVYLWRNGNGEEKMIGWRPVMGDVSQEVVKVVAQLQGRQVQVIGQRTVEIGLNDGVTDLGSGIFVNNGGGKWTMMLSGFPRVVSVKSSSVESENIKEGLLM